MSTEPFLTYDVLGNPARSSLAQVKAAAADRVAVLEAQLDGWRHSDTALLIDERDEARAALAEVRQEAGMRRHPSGEHHSHPMILTADEVAELADRLSYAFDRGLPVRVMWEDGLKVDAGDGYGWGLPLGVATDVTGRYPVAGS